MEKEPHLNTTYRNYNDSDEYEIITIYDINLSVLNKSTGKTAILDKRTFLQDFDTEQDYQTMIKTFNL